jgi:hypothetical protein
MKQNFSLPKAKEKTKGIYIYKQKKGEYIDRGKEGENRIQKPQLQRCSPGPHRCLQNRPPHSPSISSSETTEPTLPLPFSVSHLLPAAPLPLPWRTSSPTSRSRSSRRRSASSTRTATVPSSPFLSAPLSGSAPLPPDPAGF